jgi:hypothetical protein
MFDVVKIEYDMYEVGNLEGAFYLLYTPFSKPLSLPTYLPYTSYSYIHISFYQGMSMNVKKQGNT